MITRDRIINGIFIECYNKGLDPITATKMLIQIFPKEEVRAAVDEILKLLMSGELTDIPTMEEWINE